MAVSEPGSGLCSKHAAEHQKDLDQVDLAAAADINHSLGELYKLQARNKITPGRAAVMAANLLLRTLPPCRRRLTMSQPQQIIIDMPRLLRDWPGPEPKIFTGMPGIDPLPAKNLS